MMASLRAFILLTLFFIYCAIAVQEKSNEEQAKNPSTSNLGELQSKDRKFEVS